MKKSISDAKVNRMRNLLTKKYGNKTKICSGYTKKVVDYREGDVWEERGKQWTIKNGIKRSVQKLSKARTLNTIPLTCPKCTTSMSHPAHKKMYRRWGMCLNCVSKWEYEMKMNGTYDEWHKEWDTKNFNAFIDDITVEYNDWLKARKSNHAITEAGDIESWDGGETDEQLNKKFNKTIKDIQENRNAKDN
tara:strand:- start:1969 stop:2541 length:573 start_codon:yes stop_codon:yes gene_type:complete